MAKAPVKPCTTAGSGSALGRLEKAGLAKPVK